MKIQKLFLPLLILAFFFSGSLANAQSKSEKEKEQQEKIIELEKRLEEALRRKEADMERALEKSKRIQQEELKKVLENQQKAQQKAMEEYQKAWKFDEDEYHKQWDAVKDIYKDNWNDKDYRFILPDRQYYLKEGDFRGYDDTFLALGRDRTALTIRKDLEDVTFDTKFKYEVTDGAKGINFKVDGSMDEGTLLIRMIKPNGETLQDIEISPLADVSWNQDLRWELEEEEEEENLGSWSIVVSAENATGHYSVTVRAN